MESQHWSTCLHDHIKRFPKNYPSSLNEMLEICGLEIDLESVSRYQRFHSFLVKQRKKTDDMFSILIDDGWFNKYKSEGLTEEEIYDRFIDTCLSWRLIPLYCDVDGKYKLIDLNSFILIKQERLRSTCKEVATKIETLIHHADVLPESINASINELRGTSEIKPLLDARKGLNVFLPSGDSDE